MANHAYIPIKEKITGKELYKIIKQIVDSRFKGYYITEIHQDPYTKEWMTWIMIKDPKVDISGYETVGLYWINEKGQIEMRHGHGDIGWWTENVVNHDLLKKFDVTEMEDDGIGKFDVSDHTLHTSYEEYQRDRWIGMRPKKKSWLKKKIRENMVKEYIKSAAEISDVYGFDFTVGDSPWKN